MDCTAPSMSLLFAQLGLPDDEEAIRAFIKSNRPLPMTIRLFDAPFWSPSQAALIREKLQEDGEWAVLIDTLNAQLRSHPVPADMPQGTTNP